MRRYRCLLYGPRGRAQETVEFAARDDEAAVEYARRIAGPSGGDLFEARRFVRFCLGQARRATAPLRRAAGPRPLFG